MNGSADLCSGSRSHLSYGTIGYRRAGAGRAWIEEEYEII